jgi:GntR family transcriptional regulator, rspAB operon transcriptional repressor
MSRVVAMTTKTAQAVERLGARAPVVVRGFAGNNVYAQLRDAILQTTLLPGAALSEVEVAQRLGVSRTPVREAFRRLATDGLLTISPQVGSFVARLDRQQILDALFIRQSLECAAARLAVAAPKKERERLLDFVALQRAAIRRKDVEANLQYDQDLHRTIMVLSGHAAVWDVVRDARAHMDRLRRIAIPVLKGNEEAVEHHARIAQAIVKGNAGEAVATLREHIGLIEGFIGRIVDTHPEYF